MRIKIWRDDGEFEIMICRNKSDNTFSFVNLTKAHICTCRFDTVEDALKDLDKTKEVKQYTILYK